MRIVKWSNLVNIIYGFGFKYYTSSNLSYFWNFGVLGLICLLIQILTGITLGMHYIGSVSDAFMSVEHIMRDVWYGWLIRYMHANGASMFFIVIYIHILRGLYYNSFLEPRLLLWSTGVVILFLMIVTGFMGYVLPWGQMSLWGATVITNLCSTIPIIGNDVVYLLWGGFAIGNATLTRFYALHFLFPFVILALVLVHLLFLHDKGSNNPLGILCKTDEIVFTPYYTIKDLYSIFLFFMLFSCFVFFSPNILGHPDNYIKANAMVTPPHIVPEWYFLLYYAILRSIPNKLGGVVVMVLSIFILIFIIFFVDSEIRSGEFRPYFSILYWYFVFVCFILGWIGGKTIKTPYYEIGQVMGCLYFFYLCFLLPFLKIVEESLCVVKDSDDIYNIYSDYINIFKK